MSEPTETAIEAAMPVFLQHMDDWTLDAARELLAKAKTKPETGIWEEIHWKTRDVLRAAAAEPIGRKEGGSDGRS